MSDTGEKNAPSLAELRAKIDAIDERMHRLLIERGTVIDALIHTKGTGRAGAAFRPLREAEMMRRLVERHSGALPITIAEHIWREIITTFTHIQAPFSLAIAGSAPAERMRDVARFYFGFSVDLVAQPDAAATIAHVAATGSDLGLVAADQPASAGAWWRALRWPDGPLIMAMLPFIGVAGRPADLPAFVVSPPLSDPTPADLKLVAVELAGGSPEGLAKALDGAVLAISSPPPLGGEGGVGARAKQATYPAQAGESLAALGSPTPPSPAGGGGEETCDLLLAVPFALDPAAIRLKAAATGLSVDRVAIVGACARGIALDGTPSPLYGSPVRETAS